MSQVASRTVFRMSEPAFARALATEIAPDRPDPIRLVDDAVRSVLADIRGAGRRRPPADGSQPFTDRLLGVRQVELMPAGTRTVRIATGTVVTPLARDLLKRRGIEIRLGGLGEARRLARGEWAFAIGEESGMLQALRRGLLEDPGEWLELGPALDDVGGWLLETAGRGALWITGEGARTVWRACRLPGIRAAIGAEPSDVHRAVKGLGMNLMVVEPAGKSIALIRQLAAAFRRSGAPTAPEGLDEEDRR
ncbi:hypothetical protein OJF2_52010 [Aquisphaera giovannonii]|uniref:Uncharacterized protein n=1 Tax=Aquisphaera giovannonii TaxID=406548 RepID=A0A5B9W7G0_9BACT|nr:hypothetical protein [Aquisphaera giovannonii]QEH36616.1 hypothetical protein OJF2_52010 [Aquisphaera giovannonii]